MNKYKIKANLRKKKGTKNSRKLRKKNKIPAIIYSKKKNFLISIKYNKFFNLIKKNLKLENILFIIKIKKKKIICKIKEIQKHPFKNKILHIDFIY